MIQKFTEEVKNVILDKLRDVNTIIPGRIVTFDPDKCEASILPFGKFKKPDGSMMDYPQLNEVPCYVMQGGGQTATVVFPISEGDECIVLFSEQTLDTWRTKAKSDTDLRFDLSNALALVGLFSQPNPLVKEACADDALIVEKDGERLKLKKGETYIQDTAGQSITLTPDAVTMVVNKLDIQSAGDVNINAGGSITTTAGSDITNTAGGNMTNTASGNLKDAAARIDHN